jgi:hypothetical protein
MSESIRYKNIFISEGDYHLKVTFWDAEELAKSEFYYGYTKLGTFRALPGERVEVTNDSSN